MSRPRILIVEDERGLTQALEYNFRREGYETVVAHDGLEGLRKAQTLLPEVVVLDLMLPTLGGLDVCRQLRAGERTSALPMTIGWLSASAILPPRELGSRATPTCDSGVPRSK